MITGFNRHLSVTATVAAALLIIVGTASCAAPAPSGVKTGSTQVCAPAGQLVREIDINVVSAPTGSTLIATRSWDYKDHSDAGGNQYRVTDPVAGATYRPWFRPDPGLCIGVNGNNGLQYSTTVVPETSLAAILSWYFSPGPAIHGDPPAP